MISSVATIASSLPPIVPGPAGALLTAVQCMSTITSFWIDPTTGTQYSKFSQNAGGNNMIGSKTGMTIICAPAFFTSVALNLLPVLSDLSFLPQQSLAGQFLIIHFLKRLLEIFFLHKYSGTVSQGLSASIGISFAMISAIIMFVADPTPKDLNANIGTALFYTGIIGNFYHHYILANLRTGDNNKYVAPRGGLFNFVATPHYLFELIGWLGIAVAANHMNVYLVFTNMTAYLSGRAYSQNEWNRSKFSDKEWPSSRKSLVPFLF